MRVIPIGERVLIRPLESEERTASGIYLPKSEDKKKQGEVVEVGTDKDGKPLPLKKGEKIMYGGYSSEEFEHGKDKFIVVDFKDIIARLED